MQVWVGTSGYSYQDWVGAFYPRGLPQSRMLRHYSMHFPLVELNFTFYRLPTSAVLGRLADQTPDAFQFLVKLPRTMSHDQNHSDLAGFRDAVKELKSRGQLLGLLCQLPQATHNTADHRRWIESLALELHGYRMAVEFRHKSWSHPEIPSWLGERGIDLVAVDAPDLPGLYPSGFVRSSSNVYVRFHSRNRGNWYRSDKDRYDYNYSDSELSEWIELLRRQANQADRVFLLFNNCQRSQAAANAKRMDELLRSRSPEWEVVSPLAPAGPSSGQRLLFD